MKIKSVIFFVLLINAAIGLSLYGSECQNCHKNIEKTAKSHDFVCIECHGGDNKTKDKDKAHKDMLGGRNPGSVTVWDKTCGKCHEYQFKRVNTTIMYTNIGILKNSALAWGENFEKFYGTSAQNNFGENGEPLKIESVKDAESMSAELYRKFCSLCHVGEDRMEGYRAHHSSGCSACHFSHSDSGAYEGKDEQIYGKKPYAKTHEMNILPGDDVCLRCHNRSGRISLSYEGTYDGNNSLVPTKNGLPGPILMSGVRNLRHMPEDIHKKFNMECIDCHTSRDLMGDGYIYENMYKQTEIACEDCHGDGENLPKIERITKENESPMIESKNYPFNLHYGMEMVLTSKGRKYSNVFKDGDKFYLVKKRTGEKIQIKTVQNEENHQVAGHEKMECYSCHSKVVIQCYGCHTIYDKTQKMKDYVKKGETKGLFTEKEDFRIFYPFPLAVNQRGKISPITPGCQTFFSVIEDNGSYSLKEHIFKMPEGDVLKFAPFYGHNTGKKAVTCKGCHGEPFFAGLGKGLLSLKNSKITSSTLCEKSKKPIDAIYSVVDGKINYSSKVVRENSRPLNKEELQRFFGVNLCIVCHDKGEKRIYGKKVDYSVLSDPLHSDLLK